MTKREIKKLSYNKRLRLLKNVIASFNDVTVVGCYSCNDIIRVDCIYKPNKEQRENFRMTQNSVFIETDICSG